MRLFNRLTAITLIFGLLLLGGCSSGGDGDQTLTGVFFDSPVAGIEYSIGNLSGITNKAGEFTYP